jgi:DNA (cytosine-5)-methyltransferase 1
LLDLFSGAGGAAMGYHWAGFDVVGVDIVPQPRYPFEFHRGDALEFLAAHGREFDAIHASPPCQAYSHLKAIKRFNPKGHPSLVEPTLTRLEDMGRPYVIENVPGSNLPKSIILCGSMFGLGAVCEDGEFHQLRRHREFACSWFFLVDLCCRHAGRPIGVYGDGGPKRRVPGVSRFNGTSGTAAERREAMRIDWMSRYELSQAIPPAYTNFIGEYLLKSINREKD